VFGAAAGFGEIGVVVLDLLIDFAMGKLIGESIVGFAGARELRRNILDGALANVCVFRFHSFLPEMPD
jgi:hypothetical protein